MMVERVREYLREGVSLEEAVAKVRANGVFTTHTPVPAGHDTFTTQQIEEALHSYWEDLGVDRETFMSFGAPPSPDDGGFHMTACAMRLSRYVNGVAEKLGPPVARQREKRCPHLPRYQRGSPFVLDGLADHGSPG
jgi:starch phosphorylase